MRNGAVPRRFFVVHMVAAASVGPVEHPVFLLHASILGIKKFAGQPQVIII